ncbi:MAG: hypothetical protein AB8B79_17785 [Granulosicoccus sp.]
MSTVSVQANVEPTNLSESTFQDWNASLMQATLNDGSVLNEYMAKTMAGSAEGAALAVSFLPRFQCTPIISLSLNSALVDQIEKVDVALSLKIDEEQVEFPVLRDIEDISVRYTLNSDQQTHSELLALLDRSSRVFLDFDYSPEAASNLAEDDGVAAEAASDQVAAQIQFSLLGSRLSTQAAKKHCDEHIPIPFEQ